MEEQERTTDCRNDTVPETGVVSGHNTQPFSQTASICLDRGPHLDRQKASTSASTATSIHDEFPQSMDAEPAVLQPKNNSTEAQEAGRNLKYSGTPSGHNESSPPPEEVARSSKAESHAASVAETQTAGGNSQTSSLKTEGDDSSLALYRTANNISMVSRRDVSSLAKEFLYGTEVNLEEIPAFVRQNEKGLTFPERFMLMMTFVERHKDATMPISWTPDGLAIVVHNRKKLIEDLLNKFFGRQKFDSFTRKLYRWGFRQVFSYDIASDPEKVVFGNEFFQRDCKHLMERMKSVTALGKRREARRKLQVTSQRRALAAMSRDSSPLLLARAPPGVPPRAARSPGQEIQQGHTSHSTNFSRIAHDESLLGQRRHGVGADSNVNDTIEVQPSQRLQDDNGSALNARMSRALLQGGSGLENSMHHHILGVPSELEVGLLTGVSQVSNSHSSIAHRMLLPPNADRILAAGLLVSNNEQTTGTFGIGQHVGSLAEATHGRNAALRMFQRRHPHGIVHPILAQTHGPMMEGQSLATGLLPAPTGLEPLLLPGNMIQLGGGGFLNEHRRTRFQGRTQLPPFVTGPLPPAPYCPDNVESQAGDRRDSSPPAR